MPKYFKSLIVISNSLNEKTVSESIHFLGRKIKIKTKHVILKPNVHKVFILTGPVKDTSFIETYDSTLSGTNTVSYTHLTLPTNREV